MIFDFITVAVISVILTFMTAHKKDFFSKMIKSFLRDKKFIVVYKVISAKSQAKTSLLENRM